MTDSPEPEPLVDHPLPKIEDSPVYNFLNNLSPITTVKPVRISQAYQSICFASPPSIFTSPHVNIPKDRSRKDKQMMSEDIPVGRRPPEISRPLTSSGNCIPLVDLQKVSASERKTTARDVIPLCATTLPPPSNSISSDGFSSQGSLPISINVDSQEFPPGRDSPECDWENLMIDNTDLWIFTSPVNPEKQVEPMEEFVVAQQRTLCEANLQVVSQNIPIECIESCSAAKENEEPNLPSHAGIANSNRAMRRCLNFEDAGGRKQTMIPNLSPFIQADEASKRLSSQSTCMIPGIGLHLNSLAISAKESKGIKMESLCSPLISDEIMCIDTNAASAEVRALVEEGSRGSSEERNSSSPKKKRKKMDEEGEGEGEGGACKRCNCKKSKCLKLYCECFAAGVYCIEPCSCQDCFNKPRHEDTVLATRKQIESRNPLAFAPKVIRNAEPAGNETIATPASARHKRGCNCKKSNCLKKYCECFQGGVGCSVGCRCEGCKNTFGVKEETGGEEEGKGNGEEQTPPVSLSRALGSYGVHMYGKPQIIMRKEEEMAPLLRGGYSPTPFMKTSSPNGKRVSPPHPTFASSPLRNGRKLILQSIPSFPSLSHQ